MVMVMIQVTNRGIRKPLHQQFSELDNKVFSAFCNTFTNVDWTADFKDNEDEFCGIDLQLTAKTDNKEYTYDCEIKSVHFSYLTIDYCYFQYEKWYSLCQWDNDIKVYIVIYPNLNKIAIWRVNRELLEKSEKEYQKMKSNTCNGDNLKEKLVYKFKFEDAKVYQVDLTNYKSKYDALYKQRTKKG